VDITAGKVVKDEREDGTGGTVEVALDEFSGHGPDQRIHPRNDPPVFFGEVAVPGGDVLSCPAAASGFGHK
jgi:hypothetical protein